MENNRKNRTANWQDLGLHTKGRTDSGFGGSNKLKARPGTALFSCGGVSNSGACVVSAVGKELPGGGVSAATFILVWRHPKIEKNPKIAEVCHTVYY